MSAAVSWLLLCLARKVTSLQVVVQHSLQTSDSPKLDTILCAFTLVAMSSACVIRLTACVLLVVVKLVQHFVVVVGFCSKVSIMDVTNVINRQFVVMLVECHSVEQQDVALTSHRAVLNVSSTACDQQYSDLFSTYNAAMCDALCYVPCYVSLLTCASSCERLNCAL
eukprot:5191-Heterococcus_DN1.PRE.3